LILRCNWTRNYWFVNSSPILISNILWALSTATIDSIAVKSSFSFLKWAVNCSLMS
jgi:hypothetical protein